MAKIVEALDRLEAEGRMSIASRQLKITSGLQGMHPSSFRDALIAALTRTRGLWVRVGRTLNCFGDRPATAAA